MAEDVVGYGDDVAAAPAGVVDSEAIADGASKKQFLDDLMAAARFKTYLLSRGVELDERTSKGLARLTVKFDADLTQFVKDINFEEAYSWWRAMFPRWRGWQAPKGERVP